MKLHEAQMAVTLNRDGTYNIIKNRCGDTEDNMSTIRLLEVIAQHETNSSIKILLNSFISKVSKLVIFS
jgi:hypothetical protein